MISEREEQPNPVKPYFNEGRTLYLDTQTLNHFFLEAHVALSELCWQKYYLWFTARDET